MTDHKTGTREQWLAERLELLKAEKEYSRHGDALTRRRQELPWVRIDKGYRFDTDEGSASLKDLFRGRSQLLVYHFMFGPDWKAGCPSCSMIADAFNGSYMHLANHDVCCGPSRGRRSRNCRHTNSGWVGPSPGPPRSAATSTPTSAFGSPKNNSARAHEYNYRRETPISDVFRWRAGQEGGGDSAEGRLAEACGVDVPAYHRDRPGMSAFALEDGVIYHTYSTYARGVDPFFGVYHWLDRAPEGRNETGVWWRRHDEYDKR